MTLNYPGPYKIKLFYSTTVSSVLFEHVQELSLGLDPPYPSPGDAFATITPIFRITPGGAHDLKTVIDNWVLACKPLFSSGAGNSIDRAELWECVPFSFAATFVSAYSIAVAGTSGGSVQTGGQYIVTMRTTQGGVFKYSWMETTIAQAVTDTGTLASSTVESIVADTEAGNKYPWLARDNGFPFARIAGYPGINEALIKRRLRP